MQYEVLLARDQLFGNGEKNVSHLTDMSEQKRREDSRSLRSVALNSEHVDGARVERQEEPGSGSLSSRAYRKLFMSRLAATSLLPARDFASARVRPQKFSENSSSIPSASP